VQVDEEKTLDTDAIGTFGTIGASRIMLTLAT
jgi:hypothetical protein